MLTRSTVLVIGAGAGFDVDMPTGNDLIEHIAKGVNFKFERGHQSGGDKNLWEAVHIVAGRKGLKANEIAAAGRSISEGIRHARSIDNYIHKHSDNEPIKIVGKVAIVHSIIDYEKRSKLFIDEKKHPRKFRDVEGVRLSWLHDLWFLLHDGINATQNLDDVFNNVSIINFNYDRCVEHFLWHAIQELYRVNAPRATELMLKLRIHHPYGLIALLPWQSHQKGLHFGGDPLGNYVDIAEFSERIKTYNEEVKSSGELEIARQALHHARQVIFLGFHFHQQNVELITSKIVEDVRKVRHVYATMFDRSEADREIITRQIATLMNEIADNTVQSHLLPRDADCKALFKEYTTTFLN